MTWHNALVVQKHPQDESILIALELVLKGKVLLIYAQHLHCQRCVRLVGFAVAFILSGHPSVPRLFLAAATG